ncbi:MAG: SusC/RagA family TonB-linked outer membrane protein [Agriterribacter sp.]
MNFETYGGIQKVTRTIPMMNGREFASYMNAYLASERPNQPAPFNLDTIGVGTDWQKEIMRAGMLQNYQLNISGGNDVVTYSVIGGYYKNNGIIINSDFWRGNLRSNLNFNISPKLNAGVNLALGRNSSNRPISGYDSPLELALQYSPIGKPYNADGSYGTAAIVPGQNFARLGNPLANVKEVTDRTTAQTQFADAYVSYAIIPHLTLKVSGGVYLEQSNRERYFPKFINLANGDALIASGSSDSWVNENILEYKNIFKKHYLNVVAGFTQQAGTWKYLNSETTNFSSDYFGVNNLGAGSVVVPPVNDKQSWALLSYLARINYTFDGKVLLTLTNRYDGSSKFGSNKKWGNFPSIAMGYRLGEESFIKNLHLFDELKIRVSYGFTGNSEIGSYGSLTRIVSANPIFSGQIVTGLAPSNIRNDNLKWESTRQADIGLDVNLVKNRISFTADYYYKRTKDLLLNLRIPSQSGYVSGFVNSGELENKGLEFSLNTKIINKKNLSWNVGGNISFNRTKVLGLGGQNQFRTINGPLYGEWQMQSGMVKVGEPLGIFWGYIADGIFADQAAIQAYTTKVNGTDVMIQPNATPGDVRYVDVNGDGKISADDQTKIGNPAPKFIWGTNTYLVFKKFDLAMQWAGVYGNQIANVISIEKLGMKIQSNLYQRANNYWTPINTNTDIPRVNSTNALHGWFSTRHVENGSFARLQNFSIGYNVGQVKWGGVQLNNARVYVAGQNLITITHYSGYDPEVSALGQSPLNSGYDLAAYPRARIFLIGFQLGF